MALEDYLPFNPDSSSSSTMGEISDIFAEIGATSWRDVFTDVQAGVDPDNERGARYLTPEEALLDLYERGMLNFSSVVYYEDEGLYGIYIDYE